MPSKGLQAQVTLYLSPELAARVRELSGITRVSQAAYFREAVEDLLTKHAAKLRPSAGKPKKSRSKPTGST
jgi:predicted transcriptional regulator